jgi:hypothetical protein
MLHEHFPNLRAAIACTAAGLAVLPLIPRSKEPAIARDRAAGKFRPRVELIAAFHSAASDDRIAFARTIGPTELFEAAITLGHLGAGLARGRRPG